ncbi:MAG: hypothetical protein LBF27_21615 [Sphingobacterium sp.]|jgi:hypothetical protein|nr:hypothetical protein [Sphingobacterium sp.]
MQEELNTETSPAWEELVKRKLSQDVATVKLGLGVMAAGILKGDICDIVLPGLDMF